MRVVRAGASGLPGPRAPRSAKPQERASHFIEQEGEPHPFFTRRRRRRRCCRCRRRKRAPRRACTPGTAVACRPSTTGSTRPDSPEWGTRRTRASPVPGTRRSADASSGAGEGTGGTECPPGGGAVGRRGGLVNARWAEREGLSGALGSSYCLRSQGLADSFLLEEAGENQKSPGGRGCFGSES